MANDLIIYGKTDHEHDGNLLNFLEVCRKNNLTLNPDKLPKVSFFGHIWSDKGLSAYPKKTEAMKDGNSTGCGNHEKFPQIGQLSQFNPCLAELSNPLRDICRQKLECKINKATPAQSDTPSR